MYISNRKYEGSRRSSGIVNCTISGNEEDVPLHKQNYKGPICRADGCSLADCLNSLARSQGNAGSVRSRKSVSSVDDDEFIAPSESEVSCSGAIDVDAPESDSKDVPKKSKYKSGDEPEKTIMRPAMKNRANASQENGQNFLLTAAEQRALEKKADKKEKEDAFPFLLDIRDVSSLLASYCLLLKPKDRKIKIDQGTRTTMPGRSTFTLAHGRPSHPLRNR